MCVVKMDSGVGECTENPDPDLVDCADAREFEATKGRVDKGDRLSRRKNWRLNNVFQIQTKT
jgi:hypothetical protein